MTADSLVLRSSRFGDARLLYRPVERHALGTPAPLPIIGTWLLESIVDTLTDGSLASWMGPRPIGAIVYSASGHVSVQFMRDPRPGLPAGAASGANAAELAGADPPRPHVTSWWRAI